MTTRKNCAASTPQLAFTLSELLVVVAVIALLAVLVIPALGGTATGKGKFLTQVARCVSNYRQWGVIANLYANDHAGYLPAFDQPNTGFIVNGVSSSMLPNLAPYGLTVPMWFCPVRPEEFDETNSWYVANFHTAIANTDDLSRYVSSTYAYFALLNHNWWVPREINGNPNELFPQVTPPPPGFIQTSVATRTTEGWPTATTSTNAHDQPIITDLMECLFTTNVTSATGGHPLNGAIVNINRGYADGRVETVPVANIQWQLMAIYFVFY